MTVRRSGFRASVMVAHFAVVILSVLGASWLYLGTRWADTLEQNLSYPAIALALYAVGAVVIFDLAGIYRFDKRWSVTGKLVDVSKGVAALVVATVILLFFFNLDEISRVVVALAFALIWIGVVGTTLGARSCVAWQRDRGRGGRIAIVVGSGVEARRFVNDLSHNHPELGIRVVGYVGESDATWVPLPHLGPVLDLPMILANRVVDEVLVALPASDWSTIDAATKAAQIQGKTVRIPLHAGDYALSHGHVEHLSGLPVLTVESGPTHAIGMAFKRTVDIVASGLALVVLSPVILIVGLVIWLTDGRPLVYTDQRAGIHGRPIKVHKFRTMVRNADDLRTDLAGQNDRTGPDFKVVDDPRITRVGGFLRRSSLDELPQFWDILVGRMSLVGPRAQRLDEVAGYDAWHRRRLSVRPGLTGLWQVTARQDPSFEVRARLDLEYIDNWSPALDLRIVLTTIPALLKSTGT